MSVAQIGPVYVPQNTHAAEAIPAAADTVILPARPGFAGFWLRAIANFIDTVFIVLLLFIIAYIFPSFFEKFLPPPSASIQDLMQPKPVLIFIFIGLEFLYHSLFEASLWQATPGKRMLRLYVTDLNGERVTLARACLRNASRQISGFLFIGYVMAGLTEKKQALHDMIAGCLVFRRR